VSVLHGAHLSPSGRLGNLVRKYHQSVSSAGSTLTTTTASGEASNARNKEVHRVHINGPFQPKDSGWSFCTVEGGHGISHFGGTVFD